MIDSQFEAVIARIRPLDRQAHAAAAVAMDAKTKPRGSLGRIEELACTIAGIRGHANPGPLAAAIVVAAADHGVAGEGVSAYPAEVTWQMVANFARGGAAINVLARETGARLIVVDAGVLKPFTSDGVRQARAGSGTSNFLRGPAMTRDEALAAIEEGLLLAAELADTGIGITALGEMGIGNTTSASALTAALLELPAEQACGRGTGLDADGVAHKTAVVSAALELHRTSLDDPLETLAALGGFEIAFLVGVILGCAANRVVVLLDGFITGAAALVATRIAPVVSGSLVAAHRSSEPGHRHILDALELSPLLELDLRLGEGSGAALALPLLHAALAILADMETFESAGVTDAGH
jgi:nicotinate-nucleotide--dimethylbenzimidazole phosphoribosyltransferase